jgi:hypothetical protein
MCKNAQRKNQPLGGALTSAATAYRSLAQSRTAFSASSSSQAWRNAARTAAADAQPQLATDGVTERLVRIERRLDLRDA